MRRDREESRVLWHSVDNNRASGIGTMHEEESITQPHSCAGMLDVKHGNCAADVVVGVECSGVFLVDVEFL